MAFKHDYWPDGYWSEQYWPSFYWPGTEGEVGFIDAIITFGLPTEITGIDFFRLLESDEANFFPLPTAITSFISDIEATTKIEADVGGTPRIESVILGTITIGTGEQ